MTSSLANKPSTITAEAFFAPTVVRRNPAAAKIDARICQHILEKEDRRAVRRRERLLAAADKRAAPAVIDADAAAAIEHSERERDVRDAVRAFARSATWLEHVSEDTKDDLLQLVAQHQRGVISGGEFHKAIAEARRVAVGSTPYRDPVRERVNDWRLSNSPPGGGW